MPAVQPVSNKPVSVQHSVVALRTQGESMRKIAKRLGIATSTVSKILSIGQTETKPLIPDSLAERLVPKAFTAVEKALDAGDAQVAMRYLERTALSPDRGDTINVAGDLSLTQAVTLLPGTNPSTTDSPVSTSSTESPIQAGTKAPASHPDLSSHTNFSQFSLAELEAEVARRKSMLIEAEVVP